MREVFRQFGVQVKIKVNSVPELFRVHHNNAVRLSEVPPHAEARALQAREDYQQTFDLLVKHEVFVDPYGAINDQLAADIAETMPLFSMDDMATSFEGVECE